jgi:hypothetical protein
MKKLFIFLTFIFSISFSGCALTPFLEPLASPIVTGVTMWVNGLGRRFYNEEALVLYRATKISLRELDYPISTAETGKNGGYYIIAGEKDKFYITIRKVKPHITEVSIRINFMGDQPYANMIFNQIDLNTNTIEFDPHGVPTKIKK